MSAAKKDWYYLLSKESIEHELPDTAVIDCGHEKSEIRRRVVRGGAVQLVRQCVMCGRGLGNAIPRAKVPNASDLPAYNDTIIKYHSDIRRGLSRQLSQLRRAEWWSRYNTYLTTETWEAKRGRVLCRARGKCEGCGEVAPTQVHHTTYEHVGDELLFELVAVCDSCHGRAHTEPENQ